MFSAHTCSRRKWRRKEVRIEVERLNGNRMLAAYPIKCNNLTTTRTVRSELMQHLTEVTFTHLAIMEQEVDQKNMVLTEGW